MIDNPGGCSSVMVFRQKVSPTFTEDDKLSMAIHMLKKLEPEIPKYQTRTTRRLFYKQIIDLHHLNKGQPGDTSDVFFK